MTLKIMKIEKILNELENDQSLKSGLLYKRYSGEIIPDVYVAIKLLKDYVVLLLT